MNKFSPVSLLFLIIIFWGCQPDEAQEPALLKQISAEKSGLDFVNVLKESADLNIITFEYLYNGAGIGVGDFNQDGQEDLFFSSNMGENKLYINHGNFRFQEISQAAGVQNRGKWATGVSIVDINQDGWPDIYVSFAGPYGEDQRANELYINQKLGADGQPVFKEMAEAYGLADTGHSTMAAFFDYDKDGDLDMYLLSNITDRTGPNVIRPKRVKGEMPNTDRLYRNEGIGKEGHPIFENVSEEAGITIEGYGLGVNIVDINQDGWPDIYVSNDYLSNDLLYINQGDGTFTDKATEYFKHQSYSAMGNDVADFDNNGLSDILSLDMLPPDNRRKKLMFGATNYNRHRSEIQYGYAPQFMRNTLQWHRGFKPDGEPSFSEIGQLSGISATDWSWSALWADIDMDGMRDLLVTNGYPRDITNRDFASYKMQEFSNAAYSEDMKDRFVEAIQKIEGAYLPNFAFRNQGDLSFEDVSQRWGFRKPSYSTAAVYVDLDNDGDLDYVTNNTNEAAFVYQNTAEEWEDHNWLRIVFEGDSLNRDGIGAKVWCYLPDKTLYQEHSPYRGYQASVDPRMHLGLGKQSMLDSLKIVWASGEVQVLKALKARQTLVLKHADAQIVNGDQKNSLDQSLFVLANEARGIKFTHQEQHYADFNVQPLLPHKLSQQGPAVVVGDVNGDGLDDFYVGGAFKQSGHIFLQNQKSAFSAYPLEDSVKYEEDHGSIFLDVDGDGDLDLYVVSGGNEFQADSPYYQDRLYLNDGNGNFTLDKDALPEMKTAAALVIASDFDQDGDLDLFVGGRHQPQQYPLSGKSYLLENQAGKFVDVTAQIATELQNAGMLTAALWTDIDQDGWDDLLLVGEWMAPKIFRNQGGKFKVQESPALTALSGWWNSLLGADFDQDGDIDYIAGNLGLNTRYRADSLSPLQLLVSDFNNDQRIDAIMTYEENGKRFPVHPRDDVLRQLNHLKRKFPDYASFADASIEEVFTEEELRQADLLEIRELRSCYLENLGNFQFAIHPLPIEAQLAPVYGMLSEDYNHDGFPDLLLVGNSFAPEVISGSHDAFKGLLLRGDGKGGFKVEENAGFWVENDAKALAQLKLKNGNPLILASQNNAELLAYEQNANQSQYFPFEQSQKGGVIHFKDGRRQGVEMYRGSGYLSQTGRGIWFLPHEVDHIEIMPSGSDSDTLIVQLDLE